MRPLPVGAELILDTGDVASTLAHIARFWTDEMLEQVSADDLARAIGLLGLAGGRLARAQKRLAVTRDRRVGLVPPVARIGA